MAKKKLGYTELQWTCPNCGGVNPGPEKTCLQCGAPQPKDVQFEQVKGSALIQDKEVGERVKAGPDIHCPYCDARNRGDAKTCSQCGGDLSEGALREAGKVLGAYQETPVATVACPHCGTQNPGTATECTQCGGSMAKEEIASAVTPSPKESVAKKGLPISLIVILVIACIGFIVLITMFTRTEAVTGTVNRVSWERSIAIEQLMEVEYQDWRDQIPAEGTIISCEQDLRSIEDEPQPNSEEVCGTPYSVDTGSGYAEVVQDCEYYVYADTCTYSVMEWSVADTLTLSGDDFNPVWPTLSLGMNQRQGEESENYEIYFDTSKGDVSYTLSDPGVFQQFQVGTKWKLEVNSFGGVVSVSK
jgi:ribosomal protein L40E